MENGGFSESGSQEVYFFWGGVETVLRRDVIATGSFNKSRGDFSEFPLCIWVEFNIGQPIMVFVGIQGEDPIMD